MNSQTETTEPVKEKKVSTLQKIKTALKNELQKGLDPKSLAHTVTWAAFLGVIPVIGINTFLCLGLAKFKGWNQAIMQMVNYSLYPLQALFFLPFIRTGIGAYESLSGNTYGPALTLTAFKEALQNDPWGFLWGQAWSQWFGVPIWLLAGIIIYPALYFPLLKFLQRLPIPGAKENVSH